MPTQSPRPSSISGYLAGAVAAAERVVEIPLNAIRNNPHQPRRDFPRESLMELASSIKRHGLQQPIIVRPFDGAAAPGQGHGAQPAYELVIGERRLRAHEVSGFKTIKAVVRHVPDEHMLRLAFVENVHREDLALLDRATAFCKYKDQFHSGKVEAAAEDLKISRRTGFRLAQIGEADPAYQELIAKHGLDVRGSDFLLGLAKKVHKERPEKIGAFQNALEQTELGFSTLKRLHDQYFPKSAIEEEKPAPYKHKETLARADGKKGLYSKTRTARILLINYDPTKGEPSAKLRAQWVAATTAFYHDAGFKTVKIQP